MGRMEPLKPPQAQGQAQCAEAEAEAAVCTFLPLPVRPISSSLISTCRENTYSAGRCLSKAISLTKAPEVFGPRRLTFNAFNGCATVSITAVASKPQCTMQSAHFS